MDKVSNGARSLRGGSWNNNENNLRCSARNYNNPENRNNNVGFRVVCSQSCLFRAASRLCPDAGRSTEGRTAARA